MEMLRRKLGDYYVISLLGAGGMSQVYLGINPQTQEKRAVKILAKHGTSAPAAYARFLREVEIIRGLCHPHIVKILDSGVLEGCYYYMMEHMAGGNLAQTISRGRISLAKALGIFTQVCDAMTHAHGRGVIHRDLKPSNVLLDTCGAAYVSDFGIAKTLEGGAAALTRSNEMMGTLAYLAPEQRLSTKRVDRRADVYALGAILYEMVMGFPPLGKFPWPGETQPSFPEGLQVILEKCLAIHPGERYPHAGSLLLEVEKCNDLSCFPVSRAESPADPTFAAAAEKTTGRVQSDRIESWLSTLRLGTTRERLATVRIMVDRMEPWEANAILKLFSGEEDRVRLGLIRVLGDLKIRAATPMLLNELKYPYHRECAIEALGNIGAEEAFDSIREFVTENPHSANFALLPLARTGKTRAVQDLHHYLANDMAVIRQAAIRALASIEAPESFQVLKDYLPIERDDKIRALLQQCLRTLEAVLRAKDTIAEAKPA